LIFNVGLVYKSNAGINTWHQHWQQGPLAMMQYQPDQFYSCNLVANLSWGPEVIPTFDWCSINLSGTYILASYQPKFSIELPYQFCFLGESNLWG
jgi:hypothetical protein